MAAWAAAPILLVVVAMLALGWSAARAGLAALLLAAVLAASLFEFGLPDEGGMRPLLGFAGVFAEGTFLTATILWILWPALALHHHQQHCGALDALREGMAHLTAERPLQVLLIGWFLALFLEGAAGFGTPIALTAPILVGIGVPPVNAVVLALLGHAAGVSFGALGTPVLAQVALTGLDALELAGRTALLHAVLGGLLMLFFVRTLGRVGWGWATLAAASFLTASLALARLLGPELATLAGALIGAALFIAVLRWRRPAARAKAPAGILRSMWPYALLVALVLSTRVFAPLAEPLGAVELQWRLFDGYEGRMLPLIHPGTLLLLALLVGARLQRVPMHQVAASLGSAARRLVPVTAALLAMLCLSRLMLHAGMIAALEGAAVQVVGSAWPLVAPAVGALGSFVTGSATASNVLFTSLQAQTAQALGLPVLTVVAAQGFGAAIGNIVCPHNIVAGAATVGLAGREAEILRRTLLPCALYLLLGGALVALLAAR